MHYVKLTITKYNYKLTFMRLSNSVYKKKVASKLTTFIVLAKIPTYFIFPFSSAVIREGVIPFLLM